MPISSVRLFVIRPPKSILAIFFDRMLTFLIGAVIYHEKKKAKTIETKTITTLSTGSALLSTAIT